MAYLLNDPRQDWNYGEDGQLWEAGNREEPRWKWNGVWLDLCGLSPEDYSKTIFTVSGITGGDPQPSKQDNPITVSLESGESGYELVFKPSFPPTANVNISINVNGEQKTYTIPANSPSFTTSDLGLEYPYAVIKDIKTNSIDSVYTYKTVNSDVPSGIFTISFMKDGKEYTSTTAYIGTEVTLPAIPAKTGYTTKGWSVNGETLQPGDKIKMPENGATATAVYEINSYTITYILTGSKYNDEVYTSQTLEYKAAIVKPATPTMDPGIKFNGWSTIPETMPAKDVVITGKTAYIEYAVKFVDWNDTVISEKKNYHYGDAVVVPSNPTRPATKTYTYEFTGWDTEVVSVVTANATYKAQYEATFIEYAVRFFDEDGTLIAEKTDYHYKDTIEVPADPTKDADETYTYEFNGWNPQIVSTAVTESVDYTATYKKTYIDYVVTFNFWEGRDSETRKYHYNDTLVIPTDVERPEDETYTYEFIGWDAEPVSPVVGNAEYTAQYEATYKTYYVEFFDYDGTSLDKKDYHYGDAIVEAAHPERTGYDFKVWNPEFAEGDTVTGNAEYTAEYEIHKWELSVSYTEDGGTKQIFPPVEVEYGSAVDLSTYYPEIFKDGKDINDYDLEWSITGATLTGTSFTVEDQPIDCELTYSLKEFTATYKVMEGEDEIDTEEYTVAVTKQIPEYSKTATEIKGEDGWQLSEWSGYDSDIMPREDVEKTAIISKIPVVLVIRMEVEKEDGSFDITDTRVENVVWGENFNLTNYIPSYDESAQGFSWVTEGIDENNNYVPEYSESEILIKGKVIYIPNVIYYGTALNFKVADLTGDELKAMNAQEYVSGEEVVTPMIVPAYENYDAEGIDDLDDDEYNEYVATHTYDAVYAINQNAGTIVLKNAANSDVTTRLTKVADKTVTIDGVSYDVYRMEVATQEATEWNMKYKITITNK